MTLDVIPNSISHFSSQAFLCHHLMSHIFPRHLHKHPNISLAPRSFFLLMEKNISFHSLCMSRVANILLSKVRGSLGNPAIISTVQQNSGLVSECLLTFLPEIAHFQPPSPYFPLKVYIDLKAGQKL